MDAYANVQARFESERAQTSEARRQRDQLDEHRDDALVNLAEHYLPELTPEAIRQTWSEIRPTVSQIMLRKQEHADRVQIELDGLTSQRQQQDQHLLDINSQLDQAIETQQEVADLVEKRLREDDQFVRLSDRAAIAEAALERAEANLQEIDQDSARKLPAYDNSALFRYLQQRGYGTQKYTKRGFSRRMDRWLAKYIGYNKAKQGYDFLRKTPEQMRKIIAEDRQALDTVMDELERRSDEVAVSLGLPEKIEQATNLQQQRDDQLQALDALLANSEKKQRELTDVEDSRGTYYREAIKVFREMLDRRDSRDLRIRAQQTLEVTDDQIVARLMGVEAEIGQLDDAAEHRRADLNQMQSFLEGLGRLIQRFRAAQFDSSRSQFVGSLDVFEELDRAQDQNDIDSMWRRIRSAQRWGPTAMENVTHAATHPLTQVLVNAMEHAAGGAMQAHARRAGDRRAKRDTSWGGSGAWGGGSGDRRQ
jgi:hypothetical protein